MSRHRRVQSKKALPVRERLAPAIAPPSNPYPSAIAGSGLIEPASEIVAVATELGGVVVALHVKEGDSVEAGQPLAVVEAMKMENILRAEKSAVVKKVNAAAGESLAVDAVILELE